MSAPTPAMTVRQKLEFLKQIQEHLLLAPDQYRLLVIHVLREHRNERLREQEAVERLAA
jgi:hypothetical protein